MTSCLPLGPHGTAGEVRVWAAGTTARPQRPVRPPGAGRASAGAGEEQPPAQGPRGQGPSTVSPPCPSEGPAVGSLEPCGSVCVLRQFSCLTKSYRKSRDLGGEGGAEPGAAAISFCERGIAAHPRSHADFKGEDEKGLASGFAGFHVSFPPCI